MPVKPVIQRALVHQDITKAIEYHVSQGTERAALGFIDALERAYIHLSRQGASGSPRYAHELNLPGLRSWPLPRYPYLIFYVERNDHIDVWRVLHGQRDIPAWMREPDPT